jgi:hypothetical protein
MRAKPTKKRGVDFVIDAGRNIRINGRMQVERIRNLYRIGKGCLQYPGTAEIHFADCGCVKAE